MRALLIVVLLFAGFVPAQAAVTLAVSQQSGSAVREQASRLAGKIGSGLKTQVKVVELPDHGQVEAWLNRFATADLALFETSHLTGKTGQFVVIGPAGQGLTLVGRQGIEGDLPQRIATVLAEEGGRPSSAGRAFAAPAAVADRQQKSAPPVVEYSSSKSVEEDRYFVSALYREKLHREPDPEGLEYWVKQLQSGAISKRQLLDTFNDQGTKAGNLK